MSQDSVSTSELWQEIEDSIKVHDKLLNYSKKEGTLILTNDMAVTSNYQWNEDEKNVITEHYKYYQNMLTFLDDVKVNGPAEKIPPPPKRKLKDVFDNRLGKKRKQVKMSPKGFHIYLQEHIQDMSKSVSRKPFEFQVGENVSIMEGIAQLKEAYKHLC